MLARMASAPTPFSPSSSSASAGSTDPLPLSQPTQQGGWPAFRLPPNGSVNQQQGSPVGQKFFAGPGVLPTPAETFPGGLKSTPYTSHPSQLPRLPPPPEGSPTLSRTSAPAPTQLFPPPPSPLSPSRSSSASNNVLMSPPEGVRGGRGEGKIEQPDFGRGSAGGGGETGDRDVFGTILRPRTPAAALAAVDSNPHTKMDVDSAPVVEPLTPSKTSSSAASSSKPMGLGIFSPAEHAADEERARERKRKRLAMFDLPVPPLGGVRVQRLPGGGAVAVPGAAAATTAAGDDHEMDDAPPTSAAEALRQKLRRKAGWEESEGGKGVLRSAEEHLREERDRERRALLERFLDSEEEGEEEEREEDVKMEGAGEGEEVPVVVAAPPQLPIRKGLGKNIPMRHLKQPATTPWEPHTGDALLALLATTRARRLRSSRRRYRTPHSRTDDEAEDGEDDEEEEEETVNCVCGSGIDDGSSMVQCDACACWSHMRCVGLEEDEEVGEQWFCRSCARARKGKGRAGVKVPPAAPGRGVRGKTAPQLPPVKKAARVRRTAPTPSLAPPSQTTTTTKSYPPPLTLKPLAPSLNPGPPSTPVRSNMHREPTFAPADDSGVHGRAAMRMKGADMLVPRTPTMSVGEPTPWLGGTPRFAQHPHAQQQQQQQHMQQQHAQQQQQQQQQGQFQEQDRGGPGQYGLSTPLTSRRVPAYNYGYTYNNYQPPSQQQLQQQQQQQGSPVKRTHSLSSIPGPPTDHNSAGHHTVWAGTTPRTYEDFDRAMAPPPPPGGGATPNTAAGMYDFGSTPSRGLKFGVPFSVGPGGMGMGMMTPMGMGGAKRRSWESQMRAPTWGLLTPVVGEDSPGREREGMSAGMPVHQHQPQQQQQPQQEVRLPGLGFWGTTTPESTGFGNMDYRTLPGGHGHGPPPLPPGPMMMAPPDSPTSRRTFVPVQHYQPQQAPPHPGNALLAPFAIVERPPQAKGPRNDESDDEGDVKHMIEQM